MIVNHRRMLLFVLLLATSMLACEVSVDFGGGTAETPTQPPVSMPSVPSWPLVLTDDFSDPESGFSRDSDENRRYFYRDGYYGIEILREDWFNWTWRGEIFSDFMLEVDVIAQREGGEGGVIFRRQGDHQFYHFSITADGSYRVRKKTGPQVEDWAEIVGSTESPHILTGLATNRLGVVGEGSSLSLYVNGQYLDTVQDTTYTEGKIGLTAGTFEGENHALFHFDNLRVYAPTAALAPTGTPAPVPSTPTFVPPTPTIPPQPSVLFEDDFSDPGSGWEVGDYTNGSVGYGDGAYFVIARETGNTLAGRANRSFDDIAIEVDATQISAGPEDNNDFGLICRAQTNGDGYYLLISGDGYYTIIKHENDAFESLVDWTASDIIRQGNATNRIRAVCAGSDLGLFVNGELLAEASDSAISQGDIGLTATTYEEEPTEVHFDNLRVYAPAPMVQQTPAPTPPPSATPVRPTPTRGPVEFDPIIFAQGLTAELDPIMPSMTFPSDTRQVYAVWACRGMYLGLEQYHVWYHNGQELASATHRWEETGERGRCYGDLHSDTADPLPSGNYRLELWVGAKLLQSGTFVIE